MVRRTQEGPRGLSRATPATIRRRCVVRGEALLPGRPVTSSGGERSWGAGIPVLVPSFGNGEGVVEQ